MPIIRVKYDYNDTEFHCNCPQNSGTTDLTPQRVYDRNGSGRIIFHHFVTATAGWSGSQVSAYPYCLNIRVPHELLNGGVGHVLRGNKVERHTYKL